MIKNSIKTINRFYSTSASTNEIKHITLKSNGYGGMLSILGQNQSIKFSTPITQDNGTVVVKHLVENKAFEGTLVNRKKLQHELTDKQIEEIQSLRSTQSQKQLAEKFKTTPYIISRVSRCTPEKRQSMIDQFLIKKPKVVESSDEKKSRLDEWTKKSQQREYDLKVIKAAESFERIKRHKTLINQHNYRAHQESFDLITSSQKSRFEDNKPKVFTMEEKKAKAKMLSKLRRRKVVSEKEKVNENIKRAKNKSEKKALRAASKQQ